MQHPGFSALNAPRPEIGSLAHRGTPIRVEGVQPRYGCLRMVVGSSHVLPVTDAKGAALKDRGGRAVTVRTTAKDRRLYPHASGFLFCLHADCAGKAWATEGELVRAHPSALDMARDKASHVIGFFSPDPVNPPEDGCEACKKATREASATATAAARKASKDAGEIVVPWPCTDHAGGVIGLLTPGEPAELV